jgi:hypothetical protein
MGKRLAIITQADVARTLRAAKQAGADNVEVRPDGTIIVNLAADPARRPAPIETRPEIVL